MTSRITLSGLLNALDGITAAEGRILFATTNKYSALDAALCRPGRMDVHIEFKLASKYQAREIFQYFYIPEPEKGTAKKIADASMEKSRAENDCADERDALLPKPSQSDPGTLPGSGSLGGDSHNHLRPHLCHSPAQFTSLAAQFTNAVPEREFSMASLQGYLMRYKARPVEAVRDFQAWTEKNRAEKANES